MADTQAVINYPVYIGVWTNWSLGGRVTGSTITLTHRNGALLTAFLAVFITVVGSSLWRIICFALYQSFLPKKRLSLDGLYHQRQAILRNASDEKTSFISLCQIVWAWRQRAFRPLRRMVPIIGLSLFVITASSLAGIFSSRISSGMGNEVLISSSTCGIPSINVSGNATIQQVVEVLSPWNSQRLASYSNYAQRCYSNSSDIDSCAPFIKRQLFTSVNKNADCPFEERICRNKNRNIKLDTGYLDSREDLGLNTPTSLQFKFRYTLHCAPLKSENYTKVAFYSQDKPYVQYFYGTPLNYSSNITKPPFTFEVEQQSIEEVSRRAYDSPYAEHRICARACFVTNGSCSKDGLGDFIPIEELAQKDGDVTLVFLSANGVLYTEPVEDSWYAAHQTSKSTARIIDSPYLGSAPTYLSDEPASALGCTEQYQNCDTTLPLEKGCSPLGGMGTTDSDFQRPTTRREKALYWGRSEFGLRAVLNTLQSSSLTSRFGLSEGIQGPLPADQWQLEVENWFNILLATVQGMNLDIAIGPRNGEMLKYFWKRPSNDVEKYLCKNQKIISTAYINFSAMWLIIVLIIGTLIVLVQYSLETIVVWLERRGVIKSSSADWFSNSTLQFQRMAHEELGIGDWEGCRGPGVIPVTRKGQLLGVLDVTDPEHPRLMNPAASSQKSENAASFVDGSTKEGAAANGSQTEVNENSSTYASQESSQYNASQRSASHDGTSLGVASDFQTNCQNNGQADSTMAGSQDFQTVILEHSFDMHPVPEREAPASSPNASST